MIRWGGEETDARQDERVHAGRLAVRQRQGQRDRERGKGSREIVYIKSAPPSITTAGNTG